MYSLGIYITYNIYPDYGLEQENVMRRLEVFDTTSLPELNSQAPSWMYDNAFSILMWIVHEINKNIHLVDPSERFFEREVDDFVPVKVINQFISKRIYVFLTFVV